MSDVLTGNLLPYNNLSPELRRALNMVYSIDIGNSVISYMNKIYKVLIKRTPPDFLVGVDCRTLVDFFIKLFEAKQFVPERDFHLTRNSILTNSILAFTSMPFSSQYHALIVAVDPRGSMVEIYQSNGNSIRMFQKKMSVDFFMRCYELLLYIRSKSNELINNNTTEMYELFNSSRDETREVLKLFKDIALFENDMVNFNTYGYVDEMLIHSEFEPWFGNLVTYENASIEPKQEENEYTEETESEMNELSPNDPISRNFFIASNVRSSIVKIILQYAKFDLDIVLYRMPNSHHIQSMSPLKSLSNTFSKKYSRNYSRNYSRKIKTRKTRKAKRG